MDSGKLGARVRMGLLVLSLLCSGGVVRGDCTLRGVVKAASLPLEDAEVVLRHKNVEIGRVNTGREGNYQLAFPKFPDGLRVVTATISKKHFISDERHLVGTGNSPCPRSSQHSVELERASVLPASTFSVTGHTIYIAPYEMYGEGGEELEQRINEQLPKFVKSGIGAYTSMLGESTADIDFSVDHLGEALSYEQGEKLRVAGEARNALAVVAGDGEIEGPADDRKVSLQSIFRTIPRTEKIGLSVQPFYDTISAKDARPSSIGRELKNRWGKQAMLSYVLNGIAQHEGAWQPDEIRRLEILLIQVRDTMTADDELKPPLDALMSELASLHGGGS